MAGFRAFRVFYHEEGEGFWAESPDAPGFTAVARTLDELEVQVPEGLRFWLGDERASLMIMYTTASEGVFTIGAEVSHSAERETHSATREGRLIDAKGLTLPMSLSNARGIVTTAT